MPMSDWLLAFGRVLASSLDATSQAITWSIENLAGDEASTKEPPYGPLGWYGRPRPPVTEQEATAANPAGECEVLSWRPAGDDRTYVFACKDLRLTKTGTVDGEVGLIGYDGGFISLQPNPDDDGTNVFLYAPRRVTPPRAHTLQLITTEGNEQVTLLHMSGHSVVLNNEGQVMITGSTADGPSDGSTWISVDEGQGIVANAANFGANAFCMLGDKDPNLPAAEFVALAVKVLTELQAIVTQFNTHTHAVTGTAVLPPAPGAGTVTGTAAAPIPPMNSAQPVAATKVKAV